MYNEDMRENKKLPEKYEEKLDFIYELIQKKLENVDSAYTMLANKANSLIGFVGASLFVYITILFQFNMLVCVPIYLSLLRFASVISLFITLCLLIITINIRKTDDYPPAKSFLEKEFLKKDYYFLKRKMISELKRAHVINLKAQQDAALWYKSSIILFFISVLLMMFSSIILK